MAPRRLWPRELAPPLRMALLCVLLALAPHACRAAHHIVYDGGVRRAGGDNATLTRDTRASLLGGVVAAGAGGTVLRDTGGGMAVVAAANGGTTDM